MINTSNQKIFFQSLGCPKNLVDTEVMLGISKGAGYEIVSDPDQASVIIVNTCSFVNDSKNESIDTILELSSFKEKGECERLIVTGCLPQRYKADLKASFPEVDAFVGTGQYGNILDFISGKYEDETSFNNPRYIHSEHTPRINSQPKHRAYLKISEGCIKNCSFCIIPKIRGTLRSRTVDSLVEESKKFVSEGAKELIIIGQDLTDYGKELKNGDTLHKLLKTLAQTEVSWLRLLYLYPDELSDGFIEFLAEEKKICKYIDMPIQHINDRMLKLMNRKVTGELIRKRLEKIKKLIPEVSIRSTLIAGYPSETEEEFLELSSFIKEFEFDHLGVFAYSHEENTASYFHEEQLPEQLKLERRNFLMEIQQSISRKNLQKWVGKQIDVLVEGPSEETPFLLQARHQGQAPEIDGCVLVRNSTAKTGEFIKVKVEKALDYDLVALPI